MVAPITVTDPLNALIARGEVGKAKHAGHAYGKGPPVATENAKKLLSNWQEHSPSKCTRDTNRTKYMSVDRNRAFQLRPSPKVVAEVASRRGSTNSECKSRENLAQHNLPFKCSGKLPVSAFGNPTIRSPPMKEVIQNKYGNKGMVDSETKYLKYREQQNLMEQNCKIVVRSTKASRCQAKPVIGNTETKETNAPVKELFKMSRFKNIQSRIDCRR